ncbi:MAG: F0F1 ATP synthase subunit delta [Stappiaceae bacterium]
MSENLSPVSGVSVRYATALFDLAEGAKAIDVVENDLARFDALLGESADLTSLVESPVFTIEEKTNAINAVLAKAEIGGLVANFIQLVAKNARLFALPGMIRAFRAIAAEKRGEVTADVQSAEPLSDADAKALEKTLNAAMGKNVKINATVDPGLIGGLVVKVGSKMIDASLRTRLNSLKIAMKEVG